MISILIEIFRTVTSIDAVILIYMRQNCVHIGFVTFYTSDMHGDTSNKIV